MFYICLKGLNVFIHVPAKAHIQNVMNLPIGVCIPMSYLFVMLCRRILYISRRSLRVHSYQRHIHNAEVLAHLVEQVEAILEVDDLRS